jgi:hypothetical protein
MPENRKHEHLIKIKGLKKLDFHDSKGELYLFVNFLYGTSVIPHSGHEG